MEPTISMAVPDFFGTRSIPSFRKHIPKTNKAKDMSILLLLVLIKLQKSLFKFGKNIKSSQQQYAQPNLNNFSRLLASAFKSEKCRNRNKQRGLSTSRDFHHGF